MSGAIELAEFVERHQEEILKRWEETVRRLESARSLSRVELRDHLPRVLESLASAMKAEDGNTQIFFVGDAHHTHVLHRLREGFDLGQLMEEVALLREAIFHVLARHRETLEARAVRTLNAAVDRVVADGATLFLRAKQRTLEAIEKISDATLESSRLEGLLERLLEIFEHTTPAADSIAILLIRGSKLELRAVAGEESDRLEVGQRFPLDAGLAGAVLQSGEPVEEVRDAPGASPSPEDLFCHDRICSLYGIPMTFNEELLGVAEMVSHSATRFSEEDKYLLRTLTSRATAIIHQHMLRESLEEMYAKEQRAVETRDELLAVVSHDLRDPINRIALGTELLLRGSDPDDDSRKTVQRIRSATQQMDRMIADLLAKASLEQGELAIEGVPVSACSLLEEAAEAARLMTDDRDVEIVVETPRPTIEVVCDADRTHQVFSNLIRNALDFVPDGGAVTLAARPREHDVLFVVSDDGPGIPEEERDRVFEPYFSRRENGDKGTGLGLYIVKRLVEAQGGKVAIESSDTGGTSVTFSLPRAREHETRTER